MLSEAFKTQIYPYFIELAMILFAIAIAKASYEIFRKPNWQQFIDRIKSSIIAYAFVKGAYAIISFIDKLIDGMNF